MGLVPEVFAPVAPMPMASTPVAPELVPVEPEDEPELSPVVPLAPAEFEPVTVARVLAPVMELPLDPLVVEPVAPEIPEVDPEVPEVDPEVSEEPEDDLDALELLVDELLESPVWVLVGALVWVLPVAVGVGEVAVESLVELEPVLVAVVTAVVVATVDCVVVLATLVVTSAQKLSHWENDGKSVCEYTSEGVEAQRLIHDLQLPKSIIKAESLSHSAGTLPIN